MIYIAILWIAILALSVGSKSPGAGFAIAIGGAAACFLVRAWHRWKQEQRVNDYKRSAEEQRRERVHRIRSEMEKTGINVMTNGGAPLAYAAEADALAAAKNGGYGVVRAGAYFFLTSRTTVDAELTSVRNYIEFHYNSLPTETARKSIHLSQPSQQAILAEQDQERKRRAERDRILSARLADVESRTQADLGTSACCLYIMHSKVGTKVGISNRPEDRLKQVQTGHPALLKLHKTWWFQSTEDAATLEKTIHGQLKVRGAHQSGEWFAISVTGATTVVSEAIAHLSTSGEIDKGLLPPINAPLNNLELTLGKLLNLKWNVSRKGNEYLRLPGNAITVFRRKRSWSYVHNEVFSEHQFPTKEAAKAAALQQILGAGAK